MDWLVELATAAAGSPWFKILAAITGIGAAIVMLIRLVNAVLDYNRLRAAEATRKSLEQRNENSAFTKEEIRDSLKYYVEPDCAQVDPSNELDLRLVADVREPVMKSVTRFIDRGGNYKHMLILADTGMGKTTFCLNLFSEIVSHRKSDEDLDCCIVPLGRPNAIQSIRRVARKNDTILILDAFDEDPRAHDEGEGRMKELMNAASDFKAVIVTCRSQFFLNDAGVPTETGVSIIRPRSAGEPSEYRFQRLYLLPFSPEQVDRYVAKRFPLWQISSASPRRSARKLIDDIPELSVRPMLLALVPDLIHDNVKITELYDLYKFMVDKWLERESKWVNKEQLLQVSKRLAVYMYAEKSSNSGDRVSLEELKEIAQGTGTDDAIPWHHLTARSLLNRDGDGNFKFAHRSVMEFLYVAAAIDGENKCLSVPWTGFMRDIFVSWGCSEDGTRNLARGREMLSFDLASLGILPLSSPLPGPRDVTNGQLLGTASGRDTPKRPRRISPAWRQGSLRTTANQGYWAVQDMQYGLEWQVPQTDDIYDASELKTYKSKYADVVRMENHNEEFRLPSVEELLSLLEAQKLGHLNVPLDPRFGYWIGDQLGRGRHLVAMLVAEGHDPSLRFIGKRDSATTPGAALWLHEVTNKTTPGKRQGYEGALALLVRSGDGGRNTFRRG